MLANPTGICDANSETGQEMPRASLEAIGVSVDAVFGWLFGVAKGEALRSHRAALYVGDHPADVAAARAGNALAVMVASGAASIEELTAAGGDVLLESLEAFPGWLIHYLQNQRVSRLHSP